MASRCRPFELEQKAWSYGISAPVCFYCGIRTTSARPQRSLGIRQRSCDHVIPLSAGGPNSYANRVSACAQCNAAKGATDAVTFVQSLGRFARVRPEEVEALVRRIEKEMRRGSDNGGTSARQSWWRRLVGWSRVSPEGSDPDPA